MKTLGVILGGACWVLAYVFLNIQFSSGVVEIGRGVTGAIILPFLPLIMALFLVLFGTSMLGFAVAQR